MIPVLLSITFLAGLALGYLLRVTVEQRPALLSAWGAAKRELDAFMARGFLSTAIKEQLIFEEENIRNQTRLLKPFMHNLRDPAHYYKFGQYTPEQRVQAIIIRITHKLQGTPPPPNLRELVVAALQEMDEKNIPILKGAV